MRYPGGYWDGRRDQQTLVGDLVAVLEGPDDLRRQAVGALSEVKVVSVIQGPSRCEAS